MARFMAHSVFPRLLENLYSDAIFSVLLCSTCCWLVVQNIKTL